MNVLCGQWKKIARLLDIPTLVFEWQLWINGTFAHAAVEESTSDWIFSIHSSERRLWVAGHSKLSSKIVTDISLLLFCCLSENIFYHFLFFIFITFLCVEKGGILSFLCQTPTLGNRLYWVGVSCLEEYFPFAATVLNSTKSIWPFREYLPLAGVVFERSKVL